MALGHLHGLYRRCAAIVDDLRIEEILILLDGVEELLERRVLSEVDGGHDNYKGRSRGERKTKERVCVVGNEGFKTLSTGARTRTLLSQRSSLLSPFMVFPYPKMSTESKSEL